MPTTSLARTFLPAAAGLSMLTLAACTGPGFAYRSFHDEGGTGYSEDKFVYVSRPFDPKTVTVVDTRTGESLWTMDVPVGRRLVIDFEENMADPKSDRPDLMRWELLGNADMYGRLNNAMPVPNSDGRRIDVSLRAVPEVSR